MRMRLQFLRVVVAIAVTAVLLAGQTPPSTQNTTATKNVLQQANQRIAEHNLDGAYQVVTQAAAQAPDSPALLAALGQIDFLRGEIGASEKELKKAIKLDDKTARAWLGLGRLFEAASYRKQAKGCYIKAFQLDPADREIRLAYWRTLPPQAQLPLLEELLAPGAGDIDADERDGLKSRVAYLKWLGSGENFVLDTASSSAEVKLSRLLYNLKRGRGVALPVSFNGGKPIHLMMDTGASGITIHRKAAEAAGLVKVSESKLAGIGDEGDRTGYTASAEKVKIGEVEFSHCLIDVTEKAFLGDEDGLIGTDIFSRFLVGIDFQKMILHLEPLPKHEHGQSDSYWEDRETPAEFKQFTPFYRLHHEILASTRVNDSKPVLFLVDTGSSNSMIDPQFASQFASIRREDLARVKGISGKVEKVESANAFELEFSHFRQPYRNVMAIPLEKINRDGPAMTGILGIPTLILFRIQIDYRDGLIDFDYAGPKY